jgi:23S rRNA pseudouridine955/2504/2580 synthase
MDYAVKFITIAENEENQRLDNFLIKKLKGVPKSHIYRIIRAGSVRVNKKRSQPSRKLHVGDEIRIPPIRTAEQKDLTVSDKIINVIKNTILFENEAFMLCNKPAGLAVHGGSGNNVGLIEIIRQFAPAYKNSELVHRIDKDTSGCILIAKKRSALKELQSIIVNHKLKKIYWAVLSKPWQYSKEYKVALPLLKRHLASGEWVVGVNNAGKSAETNFKLLKNMSQHALVEVSPTTGRTHQIRVHAQALRNSILGDLKYQGDPAVRMFLHAFSLSFNFGNKNYIFEAPLDKNFAAIIEEE